MNSCFLAKNIKRFNIAVAQKEIKMRDVAAVQKEIKNEVKIMGKKDKKNEKVIDIKQDDIKEGIVIADRLNVREAPELNAKVLMELKKNQKVEVLGVDKGFYQLSNGYAMQKFISIK